MSLTGTSSAQMNELRRHVRGRCQPLPHPHPPFVLFFSCSDGEERAAVHTVTGTTFEAAWQDGMKAVRLLQQRQAGKHRWLRIDWPTAVEASTWGELRDVLSNTKRNYFRLGLSLDNDFGCALLEQELNANAMLYAGNQQPCAQLNEKNFLSYFRNRFPGRPAPLFVDEQTIHLFAGTGAFFDGEAVHPLCSTGLNAGRRVVDRLDEDLVHSLIADASAFLARQVGPDGRFVYGYHPCFDRTIGAYNTLRHASTTYAMLEAYEVTQSPLLRDAIEQSIICMTRDLVVHALLPNGQLAAFLLEANREIKLGGNAMALLALTKYADVLGTTDHHDLMVKLAYGICFMQDPDSGGFRHILRFPDLETQQEFRTIYYDGEATFALMRFYELSRDPQWLDRVMLAFDRFIASGHSRHHDHWLAYAANELTRFCAEDKYFRFAIDNVADHLDFVENRITTFPTLLELMMASGQLFARLEADSDRSHLLQKIDMAHFSRALEKRALYLLNGHFWPEMAMFMRHPRRILGSFFIRHHAFRVRIDDVEHYLSGYIAYLRHLKHRAGHDASIGRSFGTT